MMSRLIDGPCAGHYMVHRCPSFLRAVKNDAGETDVLDQLDDTPTMLERVYVYQLQGEAVTAHFLMSPRSKSGWYAIGTYKYLPEVNGEEMRDNLKWQEWVTAQLEQVKPTK
jgi:hypothetical protein